MILTNLIEIDYDYGYKIKYEKSVKNYIIFYRIKCVQSYALSLLFSFF